MTKKKRVMHIHLGIKGGAERFLINLVNGLHDRDVEQLVITLPDRVWHHEIKDVAEIYETNVSRGHIKRFLINRRIAGLVRRFKPDVIMSWMTQAARWVPNRPDILTVARLGDYPKWLDPFENCDYLVCNTPDIVRKAVEIGWPEDRARMISNFTMWQPTEPISRAAMDTPDDAFVVLGAGRLVEHKGFAALVKAAAKLDNAYLWLLGDGDEADNLRAQAAQLGLGDRLRMPGWIEDPSPYLSAASTFCIPSRMEPLGNVVLEAWALHCPIVSTRSEGPSWLIDDEKNGLLADIDDADQIGAALARYQTDPAFAENLAKAGHEKLVAEFDREVILDRYMDFLFNNR